ncbi:MAG: carbohydrate binding domain-containing protein, partial [Lentisphaeria bacterium]|nr:carbohydrate binding domain-containing protein [Lentisphaeria bacterium]
DRAGYYHYWQRVRIPRLASWSHGVQIDDRIPMNLAFGTRKEDRAGVWFWVRGKERHYLKPGTHIVAVRNLRNGKQLDRFVLTQDQDWQPEGVGPEATPIRRIDAGEFLSAPLAPLGLQRWQRFRNHAWGDTHVEIAYGEGEFVSAPGNGVLTGGETPLRIRVRLKRAADGTSPGVNLKGVEYEADASAFLQLSNAGMQLLIHRGSGRLCGLRSLPDGRRFLPDGVVAPLFEVSVKSYDTPEIVTLSSDEFAFRRLRGGGRKATLVFVHEEQKIQVEIRFKLDRKDWLAAARMRVENDGKRDVVGVRFPILPQVCAGEDSTDDTLCFPSMSGRLIPEPGRRGTITNIHPMRAAIGFADLHDDAGGLLLMPMDWPMVLSEFSSVADPGRTSTTLSLRRLDRIKPGDTLTFKAGIGLHPGDWHRAADRYREWFEKVAGKPKFPDWVHDSDGWVTTADPEKMAGLGFNHIQLWRDTGYGGCPTYYYPNPAYRSETEYTRLASRWRKLGGHMGVYYHGNGMSRSYLQAERIYGLRVSEIPARKQPPAWDWFVRNHAYGPERKTIEKLDMSTVPEAAKKEEYPNMCFQAGDWTSYLRKWAIDVYLDEYGCDTPYWDTLACRDVQQFNPFYKMNGEGRGAMARYQFLLDMQKLGRKRTKDFYQTVEGGSELLGLAAGQLQSNFVKNLEVARYTHPEQIYYIGHSNGWWNSPKTHLAACMAFWLNTKMDLIKTHPKVMAVVRARRWIAPWLYHSRFLDNQGLTLMNPKVRGALHLHRGRRGADALIVTFMNWQLLLDETAVVDTNGLLADSPDTRAFLVMQDLDPEPLPESCRRGGGRWMFEVPAMPVSAILILAKPERATPVVQAEQLEEQLSVRVFDPARKVRFFSMNVRTEEAVFVPNKRRDETTDTYWLTNANAPTRSKSPVLFERRLHFTDFESLRQRRHAEVILTEGKLTLRTRALISPRLADADFEDSNHDPNDPQSGSRCLRIEPRQQLRHFPLHLVPGRTYRISVWVKRSNAKGAVYANVHHHMTKRNHAFGMGVKPGAWQRLETEFTMQPGMDQPHLYLYNWQGATEPAWFDNVQIQERHPYGR